MNNVILLTNVFAKSNECKFNYLSLQNKGLVLQGHFIIVDL